MTLIHRIKQRYIDFIHEGAIRAAEGELNRLDKPTSNCLYYLVESHRLQTEIDRLKAKRSPSQLKRMGVDSGKV